MLKSQRKQHCFRRSGSFFETFSLLLKFHRFRLKVIVQNIPGLAGEKYSIF